LCIIGIEMWRDVVLLNSVSDVCDKTEWTGLELNLVGEQYT